MSAMIKKVTLERFKSYKEEQSINFSDVNILLGANSSGKSSSIQSLLALKQTCESKQEQIGLLLTGKYVTLGSFKDVIYNDVEDERNECFSIGILLANDSDDESSESLNIKWKYRHNVLLINGVELDSIEIEENSGNKVRLENNNGIFDLYFNDEKQPEKIVMNNMFVKKVSIPFDVEYSVELSKFIKELLIWITGNEKIAISFSSNDLITNQSEQIAQLLNSSMVKNDPNTAKKYYSQTFDAMEKISNKIKLQDKTFKNAPSTTLYIYLFQALLSKFARGNGSNDFLEVYSKYKHIKPQNSYTNEKRVENLFTSYLEKIGNVKSERNCFELLGLYNKWIREALEKIRYLGPLREMPKSLYHWNIDTDPMYVGPKGEYFPSVLSIVGNREIYTILPGEEEPAKCPFIEALHLWCLYLKVASEIHVDSKNSFGMNITIRNIQNKTADIMNVGVGTSQVIPVLIMGLISPPGAVIVFEQPELHLHPLSQSKLADFFVAMSKLNKQVLVETHSEYMLHRIRYQLLKGNIKESKIKVNFFENKENGTAAFEGKLGQDGRIDYPAGFVDHNQSLFQELLMFKRDKKNYE